MKKHFTREEGGENSASRPGKDKGEEESKGDNKMSFFDEKRVRAERQRLLAAAPETGESVGEECGTPTTKQNGLFQL